MAQKLLTDLGSNCSQTADTISLSKADLGLTAADASLDQIIVAVNVKAKTVLTEENFNNEPTQNTYLTDGFNSFTTKNNESWEIRQITLNMARPDTGATIDPNNY